MTDVVLIGDSLGVGLARPLRSLVEADGHTFQSLAVGASAAWQWSYNLYTRSLGSPVGLSLIRAADPKLLLVSLGTNDCARYAGVSEENWNPEANQQRLDDFVLSLLEMTDGNVVWIEPPSLPESYGSGRSRVVFDRDRWLRMLDKATAGTRVRRFDSSPLDLPRGDTLHPTGEGYNKWADAIWSFVKHPEEQPRPTDTNNDWFNFDEMRRKTTIMTGLLGIASGAFWGWAIFMRGKKRL